MRTKLFRQHAKGKLLLLLVLLLMWHASIAQQSEKPLAMLIQASLAGGQKATACDLFERTAIGAGHRQADEYIRNYVPLLLKDAELRRLNEESPMLISMQFSTDETTALTVILQRYNPLGPDFTAGSLQGEHREKVESYQPGLYYRGIVEGDPNSMVAFSFFETEVQGLIMTHHGNWVIAKLPSGEAGDAYVLYSDSRENILREYEFECGTEGLSEIKEQRESDREGARSAMKPKCVFVYFECDYVLYATLGFNGMVNHVTGLFNVVSTLYFNESIEMKISEIRVWTSPNTYTTDPILATLLDFSAAMQNYGYNGDLAHYLTSHIERRGIAWLDVLCQSPGSRTAVSRINYSFEPFPVYSWTVNVVTHEIGHNLGSPHTHQCLWNNYNNTQIDDCGNVYAIQNSLTPEGAACFDQNNPIIPSAGTIMSYCHTQGNQTPQSSIDFALGFGPQPGDLIRDKVNEASCIHSCCDHSDDLTLTGTVNSPVTHYVSQVIQSTQYVSGAIPDPGVSYFATDAIYLNDGFTVDEGLFTAAIVPCSETGEMYVHATGKTDGREIWPGALGDEKDIIVEIIPNPTRDIFSVRISPARKVSGVIYDTRGNKVKSLVVSDEGLAEIDISSHPPGIYFMQFVTGGKVFTKRIVKL